MTHYIIRTLLFLGIALAVVFGAKVLWIFLNAAFGESSFTSQWRVQGGLKGFLHLASDLELATDSDKIIRQEAATRLLTRRQCDKQDGMLSLLKSKPADPFVRMRLMRALAACGNRDLVPLLKAALKEETTSILCTAADCAGVLVARELVPELESVVERGSCAGNAAAALSRMGERRVSYPWAVKVLLSAKKSEYDPVDRAARRYAMEVIRNIGTLEDIPLIEENRQFIGVSAEGYIRTIRSRESKHAT